jgi:predicted metalloprotease with PDZ domain
MAASWATLAVALTSSPATAAPTIQLSVDATEATSRIIRVKETIPLAPGQSTLVYPKWLPGEHGPTGPLNDIVDLRFESKGKAIEWKRDPLDMFAFHLDLRQTTKEVTATFSYVTGTGARGAAAPSSSTAQLLVIKGNQVVLYPQGAAASTIQVTASVTFPTGWQFATALQSLASSVATTAKFAPSSLETFVDSPILAGAHTKQWDLTPKGGPPHRLFAAADSEEALKLKPETLAGYRKLVAETGALFGARPYGQYTFLVALSNHIPHGGLEHHESSDNRMMEDTWIDDGRLLFRSALLSHELAHAWNGKFRRPRGLATTDYQQPYDTRLLWVYEGFTSFLGEVLAARAGLRSLDDARDLLAITAAGMDASTGRSWRSVADTAASSQIIGNSVRAWRNSRRGLDYYPEMYLVWLQADALIRQLSHDTRSLDDFCKLFYGMVNGKPDVVPYDRADVVAALNKIAPNDWDAFFQSRVEGLIETASLEPLRALGWTLSFKPEPSKAFRSLESASKETNLIHSVGFAVTEEGAIADVSPSSAAAKAGLAPNMQIVAVNGRKFSSARLRTAVEESKQRGFVEVIVENADFFSTKRILWKQGHRYPILTRIEGQPDRLSLVLKSLQN